MGYSLAVFLQAAFCMQSYCHVVFAVCKKNDQYDKFNSTKSQCISFGGCEPSTFTVSLNDSPVLWARNFKYTSNAFLTVWDYGNSVQKFCGTLNC